MKTIHILAVNDPAVKTYTNKTDNLVSKISHKLGISVIIDVIEFAQYYSQLMYAFDNSKYDIVMVAGHLWLASFVKKGYLAELNFDDDDSYNYDDVLTTIRSEMIYKDKQYLMPSFCDGHMVLFREPQVNLREPVPVTIKQITDTIEQWKSKHPFPFVLKAHESELFLDFLPYLRGFGVEPFGEDGSPNFYCDDGIKALKRYKYLLEYTNINAINYGNDDVRKEIQQDRCYIGLTWGGQLAAVMSEECFSPEAWSFNYPEMPWNVTWSFGINNRSEQQKDAILVLKELTSSEVDIKVGRTCGNPTRKSSFDYDMNEYKWYPMVKKMIESSIPLSQFPELPDAIGIVTGELRLAVLDQKSPEEALMDAATKIKELLKR